MRLRPVLAAVAAAGLASLAWAGAVAPAAGAAPAHPVQPAGRHAARVCAQAVTGASCMALRLDPATSAAGVTPAAATPSGLFPADLQSAYKLPSATAGAGQTIAIVDAFDDPAAESDLGVYRSQFGLPACTTANGCFRKVGQTGSATALPRKNASWDEEISLDVDMVSATCPLCHILLVEASSASLANLGTAVNTAARLGANAISNSYGGGDTADAANSPFNHPGIAVTASSGDNGFGVEYPASSQFVVAVGGTSLRRAANARGWTETAWSGAGSGCSAFNTALPAAASFNTGCARRAVADVSAIADPNTGVAVFDSVPFQGFSGWLVFGGTSVASPIIASVFGLAGNAATLGTANSFPYQHTASLFDVTTGSNGTCSPSQLCTARAGWDGPTGLGTPNGTGGF